MKKHRQPSQMLASSLIVFGLLLLGSLTHATSSSDEDGVLAPSVEYTRAYLPILRQSYARPSHRFVHPVDPRLMYGCMDLDPGEAIQSDCGQAYNFRVPNYCTEDGFPVMGTNNDHPGWDYGSSNPTDANCPMVIGLKAYGMSVGFDGEVLWTGHEPKSGFRVYYGAVRLADGQHKKILIQYWHTRRLVSVGDKVNSTIAVGELTPSSHEVEIQVYAFPLEFDRQRIREVPETFEYHISPRLLGLVPKVER